MLGAQVVEDAVAIRLELIARGRRIGGGKSIAYATAEVTSDGRAIARAEAVFKYLGR